MSSAPAEGSALVSLSFPEFASQLVYNKTYLIMLCVPLLVFTYMIQSKIELFNTELFDKPDDDTVPFDLLRLKKKDGVHISSDPTQSVTYGELKPLVAEYVYENHPALSFMLENILVLQELMHYLVMAVVALATLSLVLYVVDTLI